jgi:hypothetical protein
MTRRQALFSLALAPAWRAEKPEVSTGRLVRGKDGRRVLRSDGKDIAVRSSDEYLAAILEDDRLLGKELRVTGHAQAGGIDVSELVSLLDGKPHRIRYYCSTCSIWASKPGPCACCLLDMELKEVPDE